MFKTVRGVSMVVAALAVGCGPSVEATINGETFGKLASQLYFEDSYEDGSRALSVYLSDYAFTCDDIENANSPATGENAHLVVIGLYSLDGTVAGDITVYAFEELFELGDDVNVAAFGLGGIDYGDENVEDYVTELVSGTLSVESWATGAEFKASFEVTADDAQVYTGNYAATSCGASE